MADGETPGSENAGFLLCVTHGDPVIFSDGVIKHWDGGYCSSALFLTEELDRKQATMLLRVAVGLPPDA